MIWEPVSLHEHIIDSSFYIYRERPKYQVKDDPDDSSNGPNETSDTVKITKSLVDETIRARCVYWFLYSPYHCGLYS